MISVDLKNFLLILTYVKSIKHLVSASYEQMIIIKRIRACYYLRFHTFRLLGILVSHKNSIIEGIINGYTPSFHIPHNEKGSPFSGG